MLRVTPDTATISPGQLPPPKVVARVDAAPAPDSFASLIDSNAGSASTDRSSATRDQPPRHQVDNAAAPNRPATDAASSRSLAGEKSPDNRDEVSTLDLAVTSTESPAWSKPAIHADAELTQDAPVTGTSNDDVAEPASSAIGLLVTPAPTPVASAIAVALPAILPAALLLAAPPPVTTSDLAITSTAASDARQPAPSSSATPTGEFPASGTATAIQPHQAKAANLPAGNAIAEHEVAEATIAPPAQPTAPDNVDAVNALETAVASGVITPTAVRVGFTVPSLRSSAPVTALKQVEPLSVGESLEKPSAYPNINRDVAQSPAAPPQTNAPAAGGPRSATSLDIPQPALNPHQHAAVDAPDLAPDFSASSVQTSNLPQQPALVAISHPSVTVAPTTAAVPLSALAVEIAVTAQSGQSRFDIRLDPAELGRIDVRIDIDRHGQVTSHLTVEKPETLAMLRQDAPHLQRALDDAGFKTGDSGLQFSLRDQSSSRQNNGNESGSYAHRLVVSNDEQSLATTIGQTYGRTLSSSGGVDIRV